jgi:hypothetical protein
LIINGKPVFFCCKGCLAEAKAHPEQTLAAFEKLMAQVRSGTLKK